MEEKEDKIFKRILDWCICTFIAVILALLTRYYIVTPTLVKQTSMYPTLQGEERLILSRVKRITNAKYDRGDIVTFEAPSEKYNIRKPIAQFDEQKSIFDKLVYYVIEINKVSYIKRIIAVEGDLVLIKNGKVFVNNEEIEEEYLQEGTITQPGYFSNVIVPEGCVYVMGDNREESVDSRYFGCIPLDKVEGKVIFRYWPLNEFGIVK